MNSRTSIALIALSLFAGATGAQTTQAVEWKVSDGGNGHWYQLRPAHPLWLEKQAEAEAMGGYLATLTTPAEVNFVLSLPGFPCGANSSAAWIGLRKTSAGWGWITGEQFSGTGWARSQPCNCQEWAGLLICATPLWGTGLADGDSPPCCTPYPSSVFEWSADCNNDGIVDYGQILRGELEDLNSNSVPDICETSISSVLPPSVPAQGGSTITIRGNGFPANPTVLIGGVPATNVVRESLTRITATSPAVMPGMKSVSVNGFTLPDGIYIRSECGSDLDQDGEVTAADIAIVLLDFGPCYVTATSPQADDSKPFMLQEQPATEAPQSR
jgi:hypothetical protein